MIILLLLLWVWAASQLVNNLERLSLDRQILLHMILFIFAPVFFLEELLEIIIDEIIEEKE